MIDIEVMQDASEIIQYDSDILPYAVQKRRLSEYTDMRALCHWHDDIEIIHIYEGSMMYEVNGNPIHLHKGDTIVVNSDQLHFGYDYQKQECRFEVFLFDPRILKNQYNLYKEKVRPITHSTKIEYWLFTQNSTVTQYIKEYIMSLDKSGHLFENSELFLITGIINMLWGLIYANTDPQLFSETRIEDPDVALQKQMVQYIYEHYFDNINLDEIAASASISRSKCCKIFQTYLQQSPVAFLNAYRMELSTNLLEETNHNITQIAASVGYNHLSYFSKMFQKKYGCTPLEYRKKVQKRACPT